MWRGQWRTALRDLLVVLRDLVCLGLGVWGVVTEQLSGKADLSRLLFFALLVTAPGLLAAVWLGRTESPSSPSPPEPSSSPSSPTPPPG